MAELQTLIVNLIVCTCVSFRDHSYSWLHEEDKEEEDSLSSSSS